MHIESWKYIRRGECWSIVVVIITLVLIYYHLSCVVSWVWWDRRVKTQLCSRRGTRLRRRSCNTLRYVAEAKLEKVVEKQRQKPDLAMVTICVIRVGERESSFPFLFSFSLSLFPSLWLVMCVSMCVRWLLGWDDDYDDDEDTVRVKV